MDELDLGRITGKSAYEEWTQQTGNAGKTFAEFLETLRGPRGPQGAPGNEEIGAETSTDLTGILKGAGGHLSVAQAGVDFARVDHSHTRVPESGTADKLASARAITITGDAIGSVNFDGSQNVEIPIALRDDVVRKHHLTHRGQVYVSNVCSPSDSFVVQFYSWTSVGLTQPALSSNGHEVKNLGDKLIFGEVPTATLDPTDPYACFCLNVFVTAELVKSTALYVCPCKITENMAEFDEEHEEVVCVAQHTSTSNKVCMGGATVCVFDENYTHLAFYVKRKSGDAGTNALSARNICPVVQRLF